MAKGNDMTSQFSTAPQQAPKKNRTGLKIGGGIAALLIAYGIGAAGGESAPAAVEPTPAPTVTVTPRPEIKTVEKEVAPAACIEYIDLSEQAFSYSGEAFGYMAEAFDAASKLNVSGIEAATDKMEVVQPKLQALSPSVNAAKDKCRAAAK